MQKKHLHVLNYTHIWKITVQQRRAGTVEKNPPTEWDKIPLKTSRTGLLGSSKPTWTGLHRNRCLQTDVKSWSRCSTERNIWSSLKRRAADVKFQKTCLYYYNYFNFFNFKDLIKSVCWIIIKYKIVRFSYHCILIHLTECLHLLQLDFCMFLCHESLCLVPSSNAFRQQRAAQLLSW